MHGSVSHCTGPDEAAPLPAGRTVGSASGNPPASALKVRKIRVWDRPILTDVPLFHAFGKLTAAERALDKEVPRLLSIAQGVVARGRRAGVSDGDITAVIIQNLSDPHKLSGLFADERSDEDMVELSPDPDDSGTTHSSQVSGTKRKATKSVSFQTRNP